VPDAAPGRARQLPVAWLLFAVTALGLGLRIAGLGQDLWIDEFITLAEHRSAG
jgi:hypothetical protein